MGDTDLPEMPRHVWCVGLTLDPQALDAPAILWTVLGEDPTRRFVADVRRLEEHRTGRPDAPDPGPAGGRLRAAWDHLFSLVRGDRVYLLTPAPCQHTLTTNEEDGQRWVVTKAFHGASGEYSWCVPFTATCGRIAKVTLDASNRLDLGALVERGEGSKARTLRQL